MKNPTIRICVLVSILMLIIAWLSIDEELGEDVKVCLAADSNRKGMRPESTRICVDLNVKPGKAIPIEDLDAFIFTAYCKDRKYFRNYIRTAKCPDDAESMDAISLN
ncbi:MAG: hypothetical protein VB957_19480 [Pseudomonadales bacterium]